MINKEFFIECYNAHLEFEKAAGLLTSIKIFTDESSFIGAFYKIFDASISKVLTEEGQEYFYENIIFEGFSLEAALQALDGYFVKDLFD